MHNRLCFILLSKNMKIKIYRVIILPVVLCVCVCVCVCEASSLTLVDERRLRVFENREQMVFGPKGEEVTE